MDHHYLCKCQCTYKRKRINEVVFVEDSKGIHDIDKNIVF